MSFGSEGTGEGAEGTRQVCRAQHKARWAACPGPAKRTPPKGTASLRTPCDAPDTDTAHWLKDSRCQLLLNQPEFRRKREQAR